MKSLVRWAIQNTPAMNTLMVGVLAVGALSLFTMRRELFPEFDLEIILVTVPYPGATPGQAERGICQKIEEAVKSLDGIKKLNAVARENAGYVIIELEADIPDVQKTLNEIRSEIDRIPSFPRDAEDPEVKQITLRNPAIRVGVVGPDDDSPQAERALRAVAEDVRDDLLQLKSVTQSEFTGARQYQIDIEIPEQTLRKHGLSLQDVARVVGRENIEVPGGKMLTQSEEVLLRGKNEHLTGEEIAQIPIITQSNGAVLTVGDLGVVRDEFADVTAVNRINGKPGLVISVDKTAAEDLLAIVADVREYVESATPPAGYALEVWADRSVMVRERLELLTRNGLQGMLLVFLVLAVFLELRLAFWVAIGVPLSMLGACAVLISADQTLNMLSMFAFLMALGILVDDAIVVGENVYSHRQRGKSLLDAAIDGTFEVMPSVSASVTTTIIAFSPLLFVPGIMGKFIAVMPLAVIAMLIISLIEVIFILPCHLVHDDGEGHGGRGSRWKRLTNAWLRIPAPIAWMLLAVAIAGVVAFAVRPVTPPWAATTDATIADRVLASLAYAGLAVCATVLAANLLYPLRRLGNLFAWLNTITGTGVDWTIRRVYSPLLHWSLRNPGVVVSLAATTLLIFGGLVKFRFIPYVAFPKLDAESIKATVVFPDGTPRAVTEAATARLDAAIDRVDRKYREENPSYPAGLVTSKHLVIGQMPGSGNITDETASGSHVGGLYVELVEGPQRAIKSDEILDLWRNEVRGAEDKIAGAESLTFDTEEMGPGGKQIEFKLLARPKRMEPLEDAVEQCKKKLATYAGVFDIVDNSRPGKWEYQLTVKPSARAMGVTSNDLYETIRASYYGQEVMRLQRGRHEVKLMVRYPEQDRRSRGIFEEIRVRLADGSERPVAELAHVNVERGYSEINRQDQLRAITITADVEAGGKQNAADVVRDLETHFLPELLAREEYQGIRVRFEGQAEQTAESVGGLIRGLAVALVVMFALLTLEFRAYLQPVLIMLIIPFGAIGAILGHAIMRLDVTLFSLFGMVALTGVVVNDSIVLIDFINRRVRGGMPLREALVDAGRRRFRPVMLTSFTTIAGLLPILTETSFQAQVLIPMATSLCFGLAFTTILVLVLVPTFYLVYGRLVGLDVPPRPEDEVTVELDYSSDELIVPEDQQSLTY